MKLYERMWFYLKQHWVLIVSLFVTSMIAAFLDGFSMTLFFPVLQGASGETVSATAAAIPWPFSTAYTALAGLPMTTRLQVVAILLLVITLVKGTLEFASVFSGNRLTLHVVRHYREDSSKQLMKVGIGFLNRQRLSDLQLIVDGYAESTAGAIVSAVSSLMTQVFTMMWLVALLFILSWQLSIIAIVLMLLASWSLGWLSTAISNAGVAVIGLRYDFTRNLFDMLYGMKLVRLFDRQELMRERFRQSNDNYTQGAFKASTLVGLMNPVFEAVGVFVLAVILLIGSVLLSSQTAVWFGTLLTFILILARLILPVRQLNNTRAGIAEKLPSLRELDGFLAEEGKGYMDEGDEVFSGLRESIEFRDVTFGYMPEDALVLKHMSFRVPRGARVGVVGPSGSGKSTVSELLLRFYDPQEGGIFVDGKDLRGYNLGSWRQKIGVVTQDTFLFHASIRDNIRFAKPDATDEEIEAAATRAYAHDFITAMPQGYDTLVGDRGVLISGGQRQRIAIARAILGGPEVLVFDEATSALDTESEQIVQQALDAVAEGRTVLTIAHRLSTVADSDLILVVDGGQIAESGTHRELMLNHGLYRRLVEMQALEGSSEPEPEALGEAEGAPNAE